MPVRVHNKTIKINKSDIRHLQSISQELNLITMNLSR